MTINNNNIFGAFTLNEARGSRLTGDWLNKESVANYGWFGGGITTVPTPATVATVDRIDFSNDSVTATARGPLSLARYYSGATGNSNYGWFGGGLNPALTPSLLTTVDRIDFSNDSSTASVRGPLSAGRYRLTATGNSNYGWFGGGLNPALTPSLLTTVDRIDFSNDSSTASVRGPLSAGRYRLTATGNSNYGWFGGGDVPGPDIGVSTVDRIDFSNDSSTASPRGPLSRAKYGLAATGNSNYGWFSGGSPAIVSTVDRIDFSNDSSTASVRGPLSAGRLDPAATGNSNYGWFGGGQLPAVTATVDRIDFSNDSISASPRGGTLSQTRTTLAATSGVLNIRRQKAGNYGWFGGGFTGSASAVVERIDFSNDSVAATARGSLFTARSGLAATGNSNYGWFGGGGVAGNTRSTVDRIDFSNDSPSGASLRGPLTLEKNNLAATGNSNYGWFGGGQPAAGTAGILTVDRIDFSNDSSTASVRGPLSLARYHLAATGNSNYGWFGGGYTPTPAVYSRIDRIDFSNDSSTASVRGPLSTPAGRRRLAATGNSNYGWFGGGFPAIATVDRIDFSNDSSTALVRGPLSLGRDNLAATGNSNYGWFGGGYVAPTIYSRVDRIDFSNDSSTASIRGSLTPATGRSSLAATSNTNK